MTDVRDIVSQILQSPQLRHSLENTVRCLTTATSNVATSPSPATAVSTTATERGAPIRQELSRLFPSVRERSNTRVRSRVALRSQNPITFCKDVIVLKSPCSYHTLRGSDKSTAYESGFALSNVQFNSNWTQEEISKHIGRLFNEQLGDKVFEIMVPIGGRLVKPSLPPGEELGGRALKMVFNQKIIYIRPFGNIGTGLIAAHSEELGEEARMHTSASVEQPSNLVLDDFDEYEHNLAIQNSLNENTRKNINEDTCSYEVVVVEEQEEVTENTLSCVMQRLRRQVVDSVIIFNITRSDVLDGTFRAMNRRSFQPEYTPSVMFTDINGTTEGAIDNGGPRREFFRLALQELKTGVLFEGPDHSKNVTLSAFALAEKKYFSAGRIIAMSLVHGGPSPNFFSENLYSLITCGEPAHGLEAVYDIEIKKELENINNSENLADLNHVLESCTYLNMAGCPVYTSNFNNKDTILAEAINFFLKHRVRPAYEQLIDGLKNLNVYTEILKNPVLFKGVFCYEEKTITAMEFYKMFEVNYSEAGSNKRTVENRILGYFRDFLIDCEEELDCINIDDVLMFTTGLSSIPPTGFDTLLTVTFQHSGGIFPKANTCSLEIHLPIHSSYVEFKAKMMYGIREGMVFGFE